VVILGALSAVAQATARRYARQGARLVLVARRRPELEVLAKDLEIRGAAETRTVTLDLAGADPDSEMKAMAEALGGVDVVIVAYGALTAQPQAERDLAYAAAQLHTNFVSPALWCLAAAGILEQQHAGSLVVIGSVAGDRGRQSNYVYGAAKAGLAALTQGLAHGLAGSGARAVVIKPGFIDTPMTAHLRKGGPLWSKPEAIAAVIVAAAARGGPVVYAPWYWRLILLVIRCVPAPIFHRTRL
jgi:short-subunit dehydrogenase